MSEKEEKEAVEVTVRRSEILTPTETGEARKVLYITYTTKDLPPGLITIPADEWSQEKENELIRQSIKDRKETKPSKLVL